MRAAVVVALAVGCHRDALLDNPPASTWFAAHLDLTSDDARAQLTLPIVQQLHGCGIDVFNDVLAIDVAITSDSLVAVAQGRMTGAAARCAIDALALSPTAEPMIDSFGGVVSIVVPIDAGPRAGLPQDLRAELARLWRTGPVVVVGATDAPVSWGFTAAGDQALWFESQATAFEVNGRIAIALESYADAPRPILDGRFVRIERKRDLVSSIGEAIAIRRSLMESARLSSGVMAPTIETGDQVVLLKTHLDIHRRGRVVWYRDRDTHRISRIVGFENERVRFMRGVMSINGRPVRAIETPRGWIEDLDGWRHPILHDDKTDDDIVVPAEHVLLVDDNRAFGKRRVVPIGDIQSEVVMIWSSSDASGIRWSRIGRWLGSP